MDLQINEVQVRVNIIEARNLSGKDSNGMSDPVVVVETNGQKKTTSIISKTTSPFWDQTFIFNQKLLPEEFLKSKIKVSVFDANTILRNELIGSKEFDYGFIYKQTGHEIYKCWVALVDDTDKVEEVQGYLKLSIVVLKPNDEAIPHDEDKEEDDDISDNDLQAMLLKPPGISTQDCEVSLKIFKGEKFPKMDTVGHCDPFIRVSFGGVTEQTKVQTGENVIFNEEIVVPITEPSMTDLIRVELFDYDKVSGNDLIATHYFSYEEIKANPFKNRWLNLYGPSHPDNIAKLDNGKVIAKEMAEGNIDPDMWVGRVFLDVSTSKVKEAKKRVSKISFSSSDPETETYTLRLDLFNATDVFGDKVFCKIKLGPHEIKTDDRKVEGREVGFYQNVEQNFVLPKNPEDLPKLFIMLYKHKGLGTSRIGWIKMNLQDELNNKDSVDVWKPIQTNYFGDHAKEQAGFIHFKLNFKPESVMRTIPKTPLQKPELVKFNLRARIYQARDLSAADQNGSSDPYCVIRCGGAKAKTKTVMDNLFPVWNEEISMVVNLPKDLKLAPLIHITVMDYDHLAIDDLIGKSVIPLDKFGEQPSEPTWYPVFDRNPNQKEGEILASFQLIPYEKSKQIPVSTLNPKLIKSQIDFGLISAKNLSYTSFGKNKACSVELYTTNKKEAMRSQVSKGVSPVFLETVKLNSQIPQDPLFSSYVHLGVIDANKKFNPCLGTGNLALFPYIPWNKKAEEAKKELLEQQLPPVVDNVPGATPQLIEEQKKIDEQTKKENEIVLDLKVPDIILDIPKEVSDKLISEKTPLLHEENEEKEKDRKRLRITVPDIAGRVIEDLPAIVLGPKEHEVVEEEHKKEERPSVMHELERDLDEVPFVDIPVYRGKKKGLTLFDRLKRNKDGNTFNQVGTIKAHVAVRDLESGKNDQPTFDIKQSFNDQRYIVRVYILQAENLVTSDLKNFSAYLKLNTEGNPEDKAYNIVDLSSKVERNINPGFFKCYQLDCSFPTHSVLTIQLWDKNRFVDDLIGETKIDLSSRFFSKKWRDMKLKPTERRSLWNPASKNPQGLVKMALEIYTPEEAAQIPIIDITPPKAEEYELRVIVWEMKNVAFRDKMLITGEMSDVFVSVQPEGHKALATDVHWRSKGDASFNWRMKWNVPLPNDQNFHRLRIQVWDKDIIDPNDAICEAVLNLKGFFKKSLRDKLPLNQIEKQWVQMGHPNYKDKAVQGEILLTVQLFNKEETLAKPAGLAREEPNQHPVLPPPNRPPLSQGFFRGLAEYGKMGIMKIFGSIKCCLIITFIIIAVIVILTIVLKVMRIF